MDKITIENILEPISLQNFFQNYWGKKHLVIRRNLFKTLFKWNDFNNVMNNYPDNLNHLQVLDYDGKGKSWCLNKVKSGKLKLPMLSKEKLFELWRSGKTFVLPSAEYTKEKFVAICNEFERYFSRGTVNIYCSSKKDAVGFPAHCDQTENFLFHTEGKVKWTIYKEFAPAKPNEILEEVILEAGDFLYIPQYQYHKVDTVGPRILISVHFANKDKQCLSNFKIGRLGDTNRSKWYNWTPRDKTNGKKLPLFPRRQKGLEREGSNNKLS